MSIVVNGKIIATDNEGYLIDSSNWDTDVMEALIKQHEGDGHRALSETAIGLVLFFREYFDEYQKAPRMNVIINNLGKHPGESFSDAEEYKTKCNKRSSCMEGFFGRIKTTTLLDDRPTKRGWKGFLYRAGTAMLSLIFAALIRVQHDVFGHLTNVTYII